MAATSNKKNKKSKSKLEEPHIKLI